MLIFSGGFMRVRVFVQASPNLVNPLCHQNALQDHGRAQGAPKTGAGLPGRRALPYAGGKAQGGSKTTRKKVCGAWYT